MGSALFTIEHMGVDTMRAVFGGGSSRLGTIARKAAGLWHRLHRGDNQPCHAHLCYPGQAHRLPQRDMDGKSLKESKHHMPRSPRPHGPNLCPASRLYRRDPRLTRRRRPRQSPTPHLVKVSRDRRCMVGHGV